MAHANRVNYTPIRWTPDVEYLRVMKYSPSVPPNVLEYIKGKGTAVPSSTKTHVTIRRIDGTMHAACGQLGLFATKKIPPRTHVIDYLGEVHSDDRADSNYDLCLYRSQGHGGVIVNIGIDAARMGNEARFINDYRGIRPRPNAVFKERRTEQGEFRMSVWTADNETIKKGDEILVSYGKAWWQAREANHGLRT